MSERGAWPGEPAEVHRIVDEASGLSAWIVLDDLSLGPAAGGIRTRAYASSDDAREEAAALARMMTLKCALADLPAGGGKGVVELPPSWDRERAFEALGLFVESLEGRFRTAGDLGTGPSDLTAMARQTRWVHPEEGALAAASGRSALRCFEAITARWGASGARSLEGVSILVQGCGAIGAAVARAAASAGARVEVCDLDESRALAVAEAIGGERVPAEEALLRKVDILSPCAVGGVIDAALAGRLRARAVCGGANGILEDAETDRILLRRGILHVPDAIASAGAVVEGLGRSLLGLADPGERVDRLGGVAAEVLEASQREGRPAGEVALARAARRISEARAN